MIDPSVSSTGKDHCQQNEWNKEKKKKIDILISYVCLPASIRK